MKNKKTKITLLLDELFLKTEDFKKDINLYRNSNKTKVKIPNKKVVNKYKKSLALKALQDVQNEMSVLTKLIIDYKQGNIILNDENLESISMGLIEQEEHIQNTLDKIIPLNEKVISISLKKEIELIEESHQKESILPSKVEELAQPIEVEEIQSEKIVEEPESEKVKELYQQIEVEEIQSEKIVKEPKSEKVEELSQQIEVEEIQSEKIVKEPEPEKVEELYQQIEVEEIQSEKIVKEPESEKVKELSQPLEVEEIQSEKIVEESEPEKVEEILKEVAQEVEDLTLKQNSKLMIKNTVSAKKDILKIFGNTKSILSFKIDNAQSPLKEELAYLEELEQEDDVTDEIDIDIMPIFIESCADIIPEIEEGFKNLLNEDQENKENLYRNLHSLKGNVGMVGALRARREVHALESAMQKIKDGRVEVKEMYQELNERFENILVFMDKINEGEYSYKIESYEVKKLKEKISINKNQELEEIKELEKIDADFNDELDENLIEFLLEDLDIFKVITEEIKEMQYGKTEVLRSLTNNLHSVKGSLGTVGYKRAKKEIHEMEDFFKEYLFDKKDNSEKEIQRLNELKSISFKLMDRMDNINELIDEIQKGNIYYRLPSFKLIEKQHLYNNNIPSNKTKDSISLTPEVLTEKETTTTVSKKNTNSSLTNKPFKIPVDIMGRLITEISEASLIRSSLLTSSFDNQNLLKEFEDNLERLKRMLRELEIHAESQIQSKQEENGGVFDPLELDRFTRLQELTRFLTEGVNDIFDIHQLMSKISNNQETMLASQERSINEVQETLGRTRLLPFSTVSSVFERVVMLTQKEVGKSVDFRIEGESTEIDGTLIDKLKTPLEHVLRNAISHGIETPEERVALGKPATGTVQIFVSHHSGKVYITVKDDGAGIKIEKVRQKAIDKGLWLATTPMTAAQAADMICLPNFSTADKLSYISGRGVGMDAVRNSIFALGGSFELISQEGVGLVVNMQVPTTIATIGALICQVGDEKVAMPVDIVDNVFMVKSEELFEAYNKGNILYDNPFTDEKKVVDFRFMLEILGLSNGGTLTEKDIKTFNHIVVVKSEGQYLAVLVDDIIGVKEVPLKPASTLLATLPGVIGVTILNDGKAAYVMDIIRAKNVLLRELNITINKEDLMPINAINAGYNIQNQNKERIGKPLVMVVDDSLTVRKATERFLQKSGFDYALAKDGQDALEMLSRVTPDLILLDVEMPRMDGFEFAKHVREHQVHNEVPIIMVTSRIADKHKKNAELIGVNEYTGKPFKEIEMLTLMHKYI